MLDSAQVVEVTYQLHSITSPISHIQRVTPRRGLYVRSATPDSTQKEHKIKKIEKFKTDRPRNLKNATAKLKMKSMKQLLDSPSRRSK